MKQRKQWMIGVLGLTLVVYTCTVSRQAVQRDRDGKIIVDTVPSAAYLSPKESLKTMHLPKGYRLELVASEPMIHEPVAMVWDGNGNLYVAEMNTYMQDVDGTGEMEAVCTVKKLTDTDGDGKMDKAVIFIDSLVLPRMLLMLDDRLLVNETNSNHIYSYRDTDGDDVADEKVRVFRNDKINTNNLEHQKSGLIWNLDNNIYVTVENVRYRYDADTLTTEQLRESPGGQWGLANDDYGRLYFSAAGAEVPALGFQQNPHYGRFDFNDQYDDEFKAVWPIISTPDVQGGPRRLRPDSTLNHFTACTGQSIYRGNALPADMQGDLFICEPVGRLIRRAKVTNTNGKITLKNAYDREEFIASTDMNFRPVNTATGPDGCLYIADMYRGIIQEGNWTKPGSYLREQIVQKGFDKHIQRGRIYRVVHEGMKPDKVKPNMLDETSAQLVRHLSHPNGWWRENAQKLLVVRGDRSVAPALKEMALASPDRLARIHALWTLDGLKALDRESLLHALKDDDPEVRKTAVWICDTKERYADREILDALATRKDDPSADVRFQLGLTLRYNDHEDAQRTLGELLQQHPGDQLLAASHKKYEDQVSSSKKSDQLAQQLSESDRKLVAQGAAIFKQLCVVCHGPDGKGISIGGTGMAAPPLAGSKTVNGNPDKLVRILLHGLQGPVDEINYTDIMPPLGANTDEYIASVLTYIRNDLGNKAPAITPGKVKEVRDKTAGRTEPWTMKELDTLAN